MQSTTIFNVKDMAIHWRSTSMINLEILDRTSSRSSLERARFLALCCSTSAGRLDVPGPPKKPSTAHFKFQLVKTHHFSIHCAAKMRLLSILRCWWKNEHEKNMEKTVNHCFLIYLRGLDRASGRPCPVSKPKSLNVPSNQRIMIRTLYNDMIWFNISAIDSNFVIQ